MSLCPFFVTQSSARVSRFAPYARSALTASVLPKYEACVSAVFPPLSLTFFFAPAARRISTVCALPLLQDC